MSKTLLSSLFSLFILLCFPVESTPSHADITFLTVDLKYNSEQGVKICEIQKGLKSYCDLRDHSHENLKDYQENAPTPGWVAEAFYDVISNYQDTVWFVPNYIPDSQLVDKFLSVGWESFDSLGAILKNPGFKDYAKKDVYDPSDVRSYHGIICCPRFIIPEKLGSYQKFYDTYPGVLVMDAAEAPYSHDKFKMTRLLDSDEKLKQIKPIWGLFPKKYSKTLAKKIMTAIPSEYLVIKPLYASQGNGVILLHKNDLDKTLHLIFKEKSALKKIFDPSYNYWLRNKNDTFIVEEFVMSDPVIAPHLNNLLFDGTMRISFILIYDQGNITVEFVGNYWKLPKKSIEEKGTFNEVHKSDAWAPFNMKVSPETTEAVEEQLREILPIFYRNMLEKK